MSRLRFFLWGSVLLMLGVWIGFSVGTGGVVVYAAVAAVPVALAVRQQARIARAVGTSSCAPAPLTFQQIIAVQSKAQAAVEVDRLCVASMQGLPLAAAEAARKLLPLHAHAPELIRQLEIVFESLVIIEKTKNINTVTSRLFVARQSVFQANAIASEVFDAVKRDALIGVLDDAASGRLADLATLKVDSFMAKSKAAKTEATRIKNLEAGKAFAAEAGKHPNIAAADRIRIREHVQAVGIT